MYGPDTADLVDSYVAEDDVMADARSAASVLGCVPVSPGVGSALRFLASAVAARAVVEIGTGTGLSGLWLLRGMRPDGVLTSIDVDPEHQRIARAAFVSSGHGPSRLRLINGMGLEVLPRLTDGGYDLVLVDTSPTDHPRYLDEALRLLRPGGVLALHGVLGAGVLDPDAADASTAGLREVTRMVREDERLAPTLLPLGGGLLTAIRRV
ncbi:MAG TPA: class I SAM-dependent methyltransferase [Pseudonocardia sp.]|nr:class I SAM-dependent methyltransferase [Pseudonocardia sp.]